MSSQSPSRIASDTVAWLLRERHYLSIGGLLYALGYSLWAYAIWRQGLGFAVVSPLTAQAFAASIIPALSLAVAFVILRIAIVLPRWMPQMLERRLPKVQDRLETAWKMGFLLSLVLALLLGFVDIWADLPEWVGLLVGSIATASLLVSNFVTRAESGLVGWYRRIVYVIYVGLLVFALVVYGTLGYAEKAVPHIPQLFGGARPECVLMDVRTSELSPETLQRLAPSVTAVGAEGALVALQTQLLLRGSGKIFVRASNDNASSRSQVVELDESVVSAITSLSKGLGKACENLSAPGSPLPAQPK